MTLGWVAYDIGQMLGTPYVPQPHYKLILKVKLNWRIVLVYGLFGCFNTMDGCVNIISIYVFRGKYVNPH